MNNIRSVSGVSELGETSILARRGFVAVIVFFTSLLLLITGWLLKGDVSSAVRPDSDDFVRAGEAFIHWIVTGGAGFNAVKSHAVFPYYFIPSVVIASIHMYLEQPVVKMVVLNSVLFSLLVVLLYRFWTSVHGTWSSWTGRRGFVIGVAGGVYIIFGLPDPFLLSYTVLSDTMSLFWVGLFVVSVSRGILDGERICWIVALVVAVTAPFVRPTGVLLPILLLYAAGIKMLLARGFRLRTVAAGSIAVPVLVALVIVPWLVSMKLSGQAWIDNLIPDMFQRHFNIAVNFFERGTVVSNRPETYVDTPSSYSDVLGMIVHRLWYFWIPLRLGESPYSLIHNIVNLVYIAIIWPLAIVGVRVLVGAGKHYQTVMLFLVMVALSYALLHSVTLLSFGWRYQLPAMIPLWMLAGVGLYNVLGYGVRERYEAA